MNFGVVCDCHNTLVNSNEAWIKAFVDFIGEDKSDEIELCLYGKIRRRDLAKKYLLDFSLVEKTAESYVTIKSETVNFLSVIKNMGIKLFVVSNAPRRRVVKDLQTVKIENMFEKIYTEENGGKKNACIFDGILLEYQLDYLLFIGNEEFDDHIVHPKVLSVALTSFLNKRFDVVKGYGFSSKGVLKYEGEC